MTNPATVTVVIHNSYSGRSLLTLTVNEGKTWRELAASRFDVFDEEEMNVNGVLCATYFGWPSPVLTSERDMVDLDSVIVSGDYYIDSN